MDYIPKFKRAGNYAEKARELADQDNISASLHYLSSAIAELCWCLQKKEEEKR